MDNTEEKERMEKELKEAQGQIKRLNGLLKSPFAQKAPPEVVEKERQKLATFEETAAKLKEQLGNAVGKVDRESTTSRVREVVI